MKKVFFLLAFAFIGTQAYSQVYIVSTLTPYINNFECGDINAMAVMIVGPDGVETIECITEQVQTGSIGQFNY